MNRITLAEPVTLEGSGLFTGALSRLHLHPAPAGTGILFQRDGASGVADVRRLIDDGSARNSSIELAAGTRIMTIEHLMSALTGLGITDVDITADGPEVPIGDGSSAFMVDAFRAAGLVALDETIEPIAPTQTLRVDGVDGASIVITPSDSIEYTYVLAYPHHADHIPDQDAAWPGDASSYADDVAPARTFCLEYEAVAMRAAGLFTHLTPRDMLVIGRAGPIDNTYRFANEPARHKLLDLIGDLALAGAPLLARVVSTRAGHALNHRMARLLAQTAATT